MTIEYRDRAPTPEEISVHAKAYPNDHSYGLWMALGATPSFLAVWVDGSRAVCDNPADVCNGDEWPACLSTVARLKWRPCSPDGTPVPWPEVE